MVSYFNPFNPTSHNSDCKKKNFIYKALKKKQKKLTDVLVHFLQIWKKK